MKKYFILDFKIPIPIRHTATVMLVSFIVLSATGMYANYNHVEYPILGIIAFFGVGFMANFLYITQKNKEFFSVQQRYKVYAINQIIGFIILAGFLFWVFTISLCRSTQLVYVFNILFSYFFSSAAFRMVLHVFF